LGIPSGLQMAVISAGAAAIMGVVAKFGSQIVGGYGAAQRLDNIIMLPAQSLGASVNSMAGQNISIGQWRRVSRITKRSEEHTSELQSRFDLVCRLLLEKKKG